MEVNEIKALIEMIDQSSLSILEFKNDDVELVLKKNLEEKNGVSSGGSIPKPAISPQDTIVDNNLTTQQQEKTPKQDTIKPNQDITTILAPLVGVFYQSSSPEAEPFAKVGQTVQKGDTICIIEAMKILNEIKAPVSGKIMKIHVNNNDVVEFNQILMEIGD